MGCKRSCFVFRSKDGVRLDGKNGILVKVVGNIFTLRFGNQTLTAIPCERRDNRLIIQE